MIKVIGFDLDGTLADEGFDKFIWHHEIPKLYAKKHNVTLEKAKQIVYAAYYYGKYIEPVDEWSNIEYWFDRFGLSNPWKQVIEDTKDKIYVYPEVLDVLKELSDRKLIIISNAHPHFLNVKLEIEELKQHFDKIISTHTFQGKRKSKRVFQDICHELKIKPSEMAFIGNDYEEDYDVARSIGIHAFHLDRDGSSKGVHVVHDLKKFASIVRQDTLP